MIFARILFVICKGLRSSSSEAEDEHQQRVWIMLWRRRGDNGGGENGISLRCVHTSSYVVIYNFSSKVSTSLCGCMVMISNCDCSSAAWEI